MIQLYNDGEYDLKFIICKSMEDVEQHQQTSIEAMKQHNQEVEEAMTSASEINDSKKGSKGDNKKAKDKKPDASNNAPNGDKIELNQFQVNPSSGTVGVQGFKNIEIFMEGLYTLCLKSHHYL